jgi:hypothetical protein
MSDEMVRAILAGHKTETRRVVKPQPALWLNPVTDEEIGFTTARSGGGDGPTWPRDKFISRFCTHGVPGDQLWVREWWAAGTLAMEQRDAGNVCYRAGMCPCGSETHHGADIKWRPSMFMPRWASRITLEVTSVRVERLHDITRQGAWAEGLRCTNPITAYMLLWDRLNAKRGYGWETNPWVWVIGFRRVGKAEAHASATEGRR